MVVSKKFQSLAAHDDGTAKGRRIQISLYKFTDDGSQETKEILIDRNLATLVSRPVFENIQKLIDTIEFVRSRADGTLFLIDFEGQDLSGIDLSRLDLYGSNFRNCDLTKTKFEKSRLCGANFSGANLSGADLDGIIAGTMTVRDNMTPTIYRYPPADFSGAILNDASLPHSGLQGVVFKGASLQRARLDHAIMFDSDFSGADLTDASLHNAQIHGINFMHAVTTTEQLAQAKGTPLCQPRHHASAIRAKKKVLRL